MRKGLTIGIILLFIGASVVSSCHINSSNNAQPLTRGWLYVGGSGPENFTTIQNAIDNSSDSDIIFVYSGVYQENLLIEKSLTINGEEKNLTVIDGCKHNYVIKIYANDTRISNFTIQNSSNNGIEIEGSRNIVENNILQNNGYLGLSIRNSTHSIVTNNIFQHNERGLCLCLYCYNTIIFHNKIENNTYCGLYLYSSCNNNVFNNNFKKNTCGIILSKSNNNTIDNNTMYLCKRCSINLYQSLNNTINYNNLCNSTICAFFNCCNSNWDRNYWNKPRILPKPIFGIKKMKIIILAIEFDWHPAKQPYDIT